MTRRSAGRLLWIVSAIVIGLATLTPSDQANTGGGALCIVCGDFGGVDALLNVMLFVPLGIGLAMAGVRASRAIPAMCLATILIETLQIGVISGRDASIGDVITNAVGGALGYLIGSRIDRLLRPSARAAFTLCVAWLSCWLGFQALAAFALSPRPTDSRYFGQIARELGDRPPYPGAVLSPTLDGAAIPDAPFDDSRPAHLSLHRDGGATIEARVVPRGLTPYPSAIIRIADQEEREILSLAADGHDVVYGVRTGASALRLRPLLGTLTGVFHDTIGHKPDADTVSLRAAYGRRDVRIAAVVNGRRREASVDITVGQAWRLLLPFNAYADGSRWQARLNALWMVLILVPAGFWGAMWMARAVPARRVWAALGAVVAVAAGLVLVPLAFRMAHTPLRETGGAFVGLLVGATLGSLRGATPRAERMHTI